MSAKASSRASIRLDQACCIDSRIHFYADYLEETAVTFF